MELSFPGAISATQRSVAAGVRGAGNLGRLPSPARAMAVALALGWSTNWLFYGQRLGVSVPLFTLLLVGALFWVTWLDGVRATRRNLWLLAPLLFFSTMVFVRANLVLTLLDVGATLAVLGLLAYFFAADRVERLGVAGYPAVLLLVGRQALVRPAPVMAAYGRAAATQRQRARGAVPVLRGVALAVPVLAVFTLLLASADSFFARYVADALQLHFLTNVPELFSRLVLILVAAWTCGGGLLLASARRRFWPHAETQTSLPGAVAPPRRIGLGEAATILALVDALFALFAWTQFAYLFSGRAAATMGYEQFRLYARRGFGELIVVTVLTICLIHGIGWLTAKRSSRQVVVLHGLSTLMIGLALVMLASAFQRMLMWESVEYYINTPVRLYVRWFIIWLAIAYGWLLFTLWFRADRFAIGAFVAALGFVATVNVLNPDADVARFNLARRDELSTRYLALLSDDAVPALAVGLPGAPVEIQEHIRVDLGRRLARLERDAARESWPSFHFARWRALHDLRALRAAGAIT